MSDTCSGCRFNLVEKDEDIGVTKNSCPKHGLHSANTRACEDFKPLQMKIEIENEKRIRDLEATVLHEKAKMVSHNQSSSILPTASPIIIFTAAVAVILLISIVPVIDTSEAGLTNFVSSSTSSIAMIIIPIILIIMFSLVAARDF